jgi:DNA-directed RNA polymerase subunit RPC12/RpoP
MSEAAYHKTICKQCGGSVEFPEESEGATIACPHCGKDLFLYRGVRAVGTPPAMDVPNRLGGNDVHLIMVGNDYDDLVAAQ